MPDGRCIKAGDVTRKTRRLVKPVVKPGIKWNRVSVAVLIDLDGKVVAAKADAVNSSVREACEEAARRTTFPASLIDGPRNVYVRGIIVYRFTGPQGGAL